MRPCNTPPINVSCHSGVHTADKLLATAFCPGSTALRLHSNSRFVGTTLNGRHAYPPFQFSSETSLSRPDRLNALSHAPGTYCDSGKISVSMYAFLGDTSKDVVDESSDVPCLRASLSVHDLESVGGASGREGLQRTAPSKSKFDRPRSAADVGEEEGDDTVGGGEVQGVESSCRFMVSSMLASPQGASEQYMWMVTSGGMVKG